MATLGLDLGGTKLAYAVLNEQGEILYENVMPLQGRTGSSVGTLITDVLKGIISSDQYPEIKSVGISVPGIYYPETGKVWAPNIPGWENYDLLAEVKRTAGSIRVAIDSDRACYIFGECWMGSAKQNKNVIFLSVGTGIGAGIVVNGHLLRGTGDIAGAIGWMALQKPYIDLYNDCGCFEEQASGEGIAKSVRRLLETEPAYKGLLREKPPAEIVARDVFEAYFQKDLLAVHVIEDCIIFWGMAAANLISLLNPEKIIWGGGVFGPAVSLIPYIKEEAARWAQPVSMKQVEFCISALGNRAGVFGAAWLALQDTNQPIFNSGNV